jgi:hypothetical protein
LAGRAHSRPPDLHLTPAERDLTRDRPRAGGGALGLVRVSRPADRRSIRFEHRVQNFQTRRHGKLHQLSTGIDEEIDEGQMALEG